MSALQNLKNHLHQGKVYRRDDLSAWSTAVDRHLKELVASGDLMKLSGGLYYCPKLTAFGMVPATDTELVAAFLKDDRFLLTSPNDYNALGVGVTQLYNETVVYNHKRHGQFLLGGRGFDFRVKPAFPKSVSKEFLLVDLINNLDRLAEEKNAVLDRVKKLTTHLNKSILLEFSRHYGLVRTKKFFATLTEKASSHAA
jgi:hypothetical protein